MMTLRLMAAFFATVDAEGQSPIADQLVARWLDRDATARCIRASANFAFRVAAADRHDVLRFNHEDERQPAFMAAELAYLAHLARRGIRVNVPHRSLAGRWIESASTPLGTFHGVLFDALPGSHCDLDDLDVEGLARWGRALGQVHAASEGLVIEGRPSWRDHIAYARSIVPRSEARAWAELALLEGTLGALPAEGATFGLVHYDFELDNILWEGERAGIIDCDDCAYYWYAADIAYALRDLFDDRIEGIDRADPRFQAFLRGYRSVRQMPDTELDRLTLYLRLHNLYMFARVYRSIADEPLEDESQWTTDLRSRVGQVLERYREGFRDHPLAAYLAEGHP